MSRCAYLAEAEPFAPKETKALEIMDGLTLHTGVLSPQQLDAVTSWAVTVVSSGRAGELRGISYQARPRHWTSSGQGRETVHFGVITKFNKVLCPPSRPGAAGIEPMPVELETVLDVLQASEPALCSG